MSINPSLIGKRYATIEYDVTPRKVQEYVKAIKNENPYCSDAAFAASTKYGSVIAPPLFIVVPHADLLESILPDRELNINLDMMIHGEQEFEFYTPIRPGDHLVTESMIENIVNRSKFDMMTIALHTKNQERRDVCRARYTFLVRK